MAYQDYFSSVSPQKKVAAPFQVDPENPVVPTNPSAGFSFDPLDQPFYKKNAYGTGVGQLASTSARTQTGFTGAANTARNPYYASTSAYTGFEGMDPETFALKLSNMQKPNGGFGDYLNVPSTGLQDSLNGGPATGYATNDRQQQSGLTLPGMPANVQGASQWWNPWSQPQTNGEMLGGGFGGTGTATYKPGFGQFTPDVIPEINAAAAKYGVPANFLYVIIAKESSGAWERNNFLSNIRPGSGPLMPYIGVFKNAADSWGAGPLWQQAIGNRAKQIEILAIVLKGQHDKLVKQNPAYNWLNVANYHFSGRPVPVGWNDELGNNDQVYYNQTKQWWNMLEPGFNPAGGVTGGFGGGGSTPTVGGPAWANVNRWDSQIAAASRQTGVPANLIKAVMQFESNGNPNARSPQGATGLMQIMPFWNGTGGLSIHDPNQNVMLGATILKQNYQRYGTWEMAAKSYLGLGGSDALGTNSSTYWQRIQRNLNELGGIGSVGAPGSGGGSTGTGIGVSGIFGGNTVRHSQEFGRTAWSTGAGASMYGYGAGLGVPSGHPGIDYSMPAGSRVYIPASGTVVYGGGSGYFTNVGGDGAGRGELRIRTDDGNLIIFGHMSSIPWRPGQRVSAGQLAGLTGSFNGDHLHLEVRVPGNTSTGWRAVNPEEYFGGMSIAYGGSGGAQQQQQAPAQQTGSWWSRLYM